MFITKSAPLLSNKAGCNFGWLLFVFLACCLFVMVVVVFVNEWYQARKCAFMKNEELLVKCISYQTFHCEILQWNAWLLSLVTDTWIWVFHLHHQSSACSGADSWFLSSTPPLWRSLTKVIVIKIQESLRHQKLDFIVWFSTNSSIFGIKHTMTTLFGFVYPFEYPTVSVNGFIPS